MTQTTIYGYRYFVSFVYRKDRGDSFANLTLDSDAPITDMAQINEQQETLRRRGYTNALILSFSQLTRIPRGAA